MNRVDNQPRLAALAQGVRDGFFDRLSKAISKQPVASHELFSGELHPKRCLYATGIHPANSSSDWATLVGIHGPTPKKRIRRRLRLPARRVVRRARQHRMPQFSFRLGLGRSANAKYLA